jgi:surface protein
MNNPQFPDYKAQVNSRSFQGAARSADRPAGSALPTAEENPFPYAEGPLFMEQVQSKVHTSPAEEVISENPAMEQQQNNPGVPFATAVLLEDGQAERQNYWEVRFSKRRVIVTALLFIAAGIFVAGYCGSGACGGGSPPTQPETVLPTTTQPTEPPTTPHLTPQTQPPTQLPTVPPTTRFFVFTSTDELYNAVDQYLSAEVPIESEVAEKYGYPIGAWDVSQIVDFSQVFGASRNSAAASFNDDLSQWNVSSAQTMSWMFVDTDAFNGNLSRWDTSSVTDMSGMFEWADAFNGDISAWDTSLVHDFGYMFNLAESFNGDLSRWDISSAQDMSYMFSDAIAFNRNLSRWDTSSAITLANMFEDAVAFNQNLCSWGQQVNASVDMTDMFLGSGCPRRESPDPLNPLAGPWCHACSP